MHLFAIHPDPPLTTAGRIWMAFGSLVMLWSAWRVFFRTDKVVAEQLKFARRLKIDWPIASKLIMWGKPESFVRPWKFRLGAGFSIPFALLFLWLAIFARSN